MTDLYQLIYTSTRGAWCDEQTIQDILITAHTNNTTYEITGVLLHSTSRFLQYIEGNRQHLTNLYKNIEQDTRHSNLILHLFSPLEKRIFPTWRMAFKDLDGQLNFHSSIHTPDDILYQQIIAGDKYNDIVKIQLLKIFFEGS